MSVKHCVRLAILVGLCFGIIPSVARSADPEAPKLRYGFQADREYPYQIEIHAKIVDEKIDRQGDLIYKVLSANEDQAVLKTYGSAAGMLGHLGGIPFPRMGPPPFMQRAPEGTTVNRRGTVLVSGELTHLPMLLGDLETLVIDEFPDDAKANWEKQRDIVIEEKESNDRFGPGFGPRFGPRFGPPVPMHGSTATTQHTAKEINPVHGYQDHRRPGAHRQEILAQKRRKGQGGPLRHDRLGRNRVRPQGGRDKKWSMTYEVKINESGVTVTIPITVSARLFGAVGVGDAQEEAGRGRQGRSRGRRRGRPAETVQARRAK